MPGSWPRTLEHDEREQWDRTCERCDLVGICGGHLLAEARLDLGRGDGASAGARA